MTRFMVVVAYTASVALLAGCASHAGRTGQGKGQGKAEGSSESAQAGNAPGIRLVSAKLEDGATVALEPASFSYRSTAATSSCRNGLGTVTASARWLASGTGAHWIEVAGHRKKFATTGTTGRDAAKFAGIKPGNYYVSFNAQDGAAAREKVSVCQ